IRARSTGLQDRKRAWRGLLALAGWLPVRRQQANAEPDRTYPSPRGRPMLVLVLNPGSSSLKYSVRRLDSGQPGTGGQELARRAIERIGEGRDRRSHQVGSASRREE